MYRYVIYCEGKKVYNRVRLHMTTKKMPFAAKTGKDGEIYVFCDVIPDLRIKSDLKVYTFKEIPYYEALNLSTLEVNAGDPCDFSGL